MTRCLAVLAILVIATAGMGDDAILLKDDPRLRTKVTLSLACEPLSLFAETISRAAGVTVRARKDVADKNVTVFAKDIPAYEAMNQVAKLLEYDWEFRGDDPSKRSYVLARSLKRKMEAEDLREAEYRKQDKQFRDGVENAIKMVDADTSAWQKAFDANPAQAVMDYSARDTLRDLAAFTKAQRDDIWDRIAESRRTEVRIPFAELPPSVQKHWKEKTAEWHEGNPDFPAPDVLDHEYFVIARRLGPLLGLPPRTGFSTSLGPLGYTGSWLVREKDWLFLDEGFGGLTTAGVDTSAYKMPSLDFTAPDSKTKRVAIKFDEKKPGDEEVQSHTLAELLKAASEMFGISIFADDYLCRRENWISARTTFPDNRDEALSEIGREMKYEPTADGEIAMMRCKTWYMDEPREVPKRLIARWVGLREAQGRLELKDYVEIACSLTNMQLDGLRRAFVRGLGLWSEAARMSVHVNRLRLCGTFSASQMEAASGSGLSHREMDSTQQQSFAALLRDARPDLADDKLPDCAFGVRQESRNREATDDETGEVTKWASDVVVFTYTFAPGDEKTFEMLLKSTVIEPKPASK